MRRVSAMRISTCLATHGLTSELQGELIFNESVAASQGPGEKTVSVLDVLGNLGENKAVIMKATRE
jgi:hypothetical protein